MASRLAQARASQAREARTGRHFAAHDATRNRGAPAVAVDTVTILALKERGIVKGASTHSHGRVRSILPNGMVLFDGSTVPVQGEDIVVSAPAPANE